MKYKYIALEGNIGAGKTTLSHKLSEVLEYEMLLEAFDKNPFLEPFYNDPEHFALPVELFFAIQRFKQIDAISSKIGEGLISDFCFDKTGLFARVNLKDYNYWLYRDYFQILQKSMPEPDVLIYLRQPIERLLKNIETRGRSYEKEISNKYLENLEKQYTKFLKMDHNYPVIDLDCSDLEFTENASIELVIKLLNSDFSRGYQAIKP